MVDAIIQQIKDIVHNNAFFQGGAIIALLGAIFAYCRNVPRYIWMWIKFKFTASMQVTSDSNYEMYHSILSWLSSHKKIRSCKNISILSLHHSLQKEGVKNFNIMPRSGFFQVFFKYYRCFVVTLTESKRTGNMAEAITYEINLTVFPCINNNILHKIIDEAKKLYDTESNRFLNIKTGTEYEDNLISDKRILSSVIITDDIKKIVVDDISQFLASREWYLKRGLDYKRGYLLYGTPGNGKTSLVKAIASHFNLPINYIPMGDVGDAKLLQIRNRSVDPHIVLIEDVDTISAALSRTKKHERNKSEITINSLTLSGFLNFLDGVISESGRILFMTTNYPEKLDKAIIRAGRIDVFACLDNATKDQAYRAFKLFFGEDDKCENLALKFSKSIPEGTNMASIQEHLLKNKNDINMASVFIGRK